MNTKHLVKSFSYAIVAQSASLILSLVLSLFLPKVLGVTEYGYWQLFIFYIGYVGLFNFGLNDGVYLINGGKTRKTIDGRSISSQFWFSFIYQTIISTLFAVYSFFVYQGETARAVILFFAALYLLLNNLSLFFGYIFQAVNETKLYSASVLIDKIVYLVPLTVFLILRIKNFEPYILTYTISRGVALLFCINRSMFILKQHPYTLSKTLTLSCESIIIGIKLTIANIAGTLITGIARFCIDGHWGIEEFGKVSFSLSFVNFFLVFITQAGMVLFPALRQGTHHEHRAFYLLARDGTEILFPLVYVVYFPAAFLISLWLPQYSDSLYYFALLLPICVFESKMSITCTTMLKVLRKEKLLLALNLCAVSISLFFSLIGTYIFSSIEVVLLGSVLAIILRSILSEQRINFYLQAPHSSLSYQGIILTLLFICVSNTFTLFTSAIMMLIFYLIFIYFNRSTVELLVKKISKIFQRCC